MNGINGNDNVKTSTQPKPLPTIPPYPQAEAIAVKNLTFSYKSGSGSSGSSCSSSGSNGSLVLQNLNLTLATGSRCLLIGANGSGKSTLLRILSGRHLTKSGVDPVTGLEQSVRILGLDSFHDTRLNFHRAYLDCDWGTRSVAFAGNAVPLMADIAVRHMMEKLQNSYPQRRDELVDMLGVDLDWRMHQLSDGQRRRVQILLGLVRPFKILLLDEITTSLDVCVRQDLLRWLVKESDERGATVIYATHIFDGLESWGTHLFYLTDAGQCGWQGRPQDLDYFQQLQAENHPAKMLAVAEHWLRKELETNRLLRKRERPMGSDASSSLTEMGGRSQGGYGSGRMVTDDELAEKMKRQGRLSDILGNAGKMNKIHRTAGN